MKFASKLAVVLAVTLGFSACSSDGGTDPDDDTPNLSFVAVANAPEPPPGRVILCPVDGSSTTSGASCPVLTWNGVTYWAFNYEDGRNSVAVVGYNSQNNVVKTLAEKAGTKNIWQITINESQETITLRGAGDATVVFPWSELELQ